MPNGYTALSNSIISDNSAQAPVVAPDCFGAIHSLGYNLVENTTDCTVGATTTGNIIGASAHLYPLAANGGPTMTSLPRWDSPEVDSANPATPTTTTRRSAPNSTSVASPVPETGTPTASAVATWAPSNADWNVF